MRTSATCEGGIVGSSNFWTETETQTITTTPKSYELRLPAIFMLTTRGRFTLHCTYLNERNSSSHARCRRLRWILHIRNTFRTKGEQKTVPCFKAVDYVTVSDASLTSAMSLVTLLLTTEQKLVSFLGYFGQKRKNRNIYRRTRFEKSFSVSIVYQRFSKSKKFSLYFNFY